MAANILNLFSRPSGRLIIFASDVSTICNVNKYNSIQDIVDRQLGKLGVVANITERQRFQQKITSLRSATIDNKRNFSTDLESINKLLSDANTNSEELEETKRRKKELEKGIKAITKKESQIEFLEKSWHQLPKGTSELNEIKSNLKKMDIDDDELLSMASSNANKNYGIKNENSALLQYSNMYGLNVSHLNKCIYREVINNKGKETGIWFGGKLDGYVEVDGNLSRIIEVKCRTNRLFGLIPIYEQYQIQTYLFITNAAQCDLVEYMSVNSNNDNMQMNVLTVNKDHDLWSNTILPKIKNFYRLMHNILTNPKEYIDLDKDSKTNYINKFMNPLSLNTATIH